MTEQAWFNRRVFMLAAVFGAAGVVAVGWGARPHTAGRVIPAANGVGPQREALAVVITLSSSRDGNLNPFKQAVTAIDRKLRDEARLQHMRPFLVGVDLDPDVKRGVDFLFRIAQFDEIVVGMYSSNLGIQQYVAGTFPGPGEWPQVLIVTRTTQVHTGSVTFGNEHLVRRAVGVDAIRELAESPSVLSATTEAPLQRAHGRQ